MISLQQLHRVPKKDFEISHHAAAELSLKSITPVSQ